ncbi:MAG: zinc ribbon domain-containing protein [Ignavibacteria bacterium]|nr:zinc ribbon domain-containing protein [Ignavibacteria bacterium]
MPFYEYQCSECDYNFEELQKFSDPPLEICPSCGKKSLKKLIGTGAGLIFKGSGFYLTDYKKTSAEDKTSSQEKNKQQKASTTKDNTLKKENSTQNNKPNQS